MNTPKRARRAPKLPVFTLASPGLRTAILRGYNAFLVAWADDADALSLPGRRMARGLVCGTTISLALWAVLLWGVLR